MKIAASATLLCAATLLAACQDPDRVLFATTSNLGIDADAATQQLGVGLNRFEGIIAPVYEDGAAPPAYARLGTDGDFFTPKISQIYSTGDAALIVSRRVIPLTCTYRNDGPDDKRKKGAKVDPDNFDGLWTADKVSCISQKPLRNVDQSRRKRMYFATGTSLGMSFKAASEAPGSLHLGFKRFETSYIPMTKVHGKKDQGKKDQGKKDQGKKDQGTEQAVEQGTEQAVEQSAEQAVEQGAEQGAEQDKEKEESTNAENYASTIGAIHMRLRTKCGAGTVTTNDGNCISQFFATGEAARGVASQNRILTFFDRDAKEAFQ